MGKDVTKQHTLMKNPLSIKALVKYNLSGRQIEVVVKNRALSVDIKDESIFY